MDEDVEDVEGMEDLGLGLCICSVGVGLACIILKQNSTRFEAIFQATFNSAECSEGQYYNL